MLKYKRFLIAAIIFFFLSIALNFPFPHEYPIGQEISSALNFPIRTMNGVSYIGVTGLILFVISLYFLVKSLEKFHLRMVLIAIFLVVFLPMELVSAYQKTLATGINAIEYERRGSSCRYEMKGEKKLYATCQFPFKNHSNQTVHFNIEFYEKYLFEDETPLLSLLNQGGPYEVIMHEKEREIVTIETDIDLSKLGVDSMSGESWGINLKIVDGDKVRKL
ncbi:hypothetical protein M3204_17720 [Mesobacillus subterraneus]|uniref:hypothetical protein n=1 Tax=Mesobacillus subterraneus TaxID=285983 RepID=UPI00204223A0|nr:hypothetical protein [Mesobacillus subterraneus]MCM3666258.1 hypothetical protein [Mesobacillus subterraneus]MCM3685257.1 hypothetical protein [Mesobacillus subterraneus]